MYYFVIKNYFNIYIYFMFYYILFKRNVLLELIRYIKLGFILLQECYNNN